MHFLHAILVRADPEQYVPIKDNQAALARYFQTIAFQETERYGDGLVFEWRTCGPGRWSQFYPEVMFGSDSRFADTLSEFSIQPLERALRIIEQGFYELRGFRSQAQLNLDPSMQILSERTTHRGKQVFLSGRHVPVPAITAQFIRDLWDKTDVLYTSAVYEAIALAFGDYKAGSCFYSVPCRGVKLSKETLADIQLRPYLYALVFSDYHN